MVDFESAYLQERLVVNMKEMGEEQVTVVDIYYKKQVMELSEGTGVELRNSSEGSGRTTREVAVARTI